MLIKFENFKKLDEIAAAGHKNIDKAASNKVRRCFTQIMSYYGFFADLFFQLKIMQAHESANVDTMATDGKSIAYNPEFVKKLTEEEINFVLIHEVMHNANFHFQRQGDRRAIVTTSDGKQSSLWNWATDYAINLQIDDMRKEPGGTILKPPAAVLLDRKYEDMSAEQIYEILLKEIPHQDPPPPGGPPPPIEIYPGMKVRLKNGKTGVVKDIQNGKYIIDEIEDEYQNVVESLSVSKFNKLFEFAVNRSSGPVCNLPTVGKPKSYDRPDFVPIMKYPPGGGPPPPPGGQPGKDKVEWEGTPPPPPPGGKPKPGGPGQKDPIPGTDDIREPGSLGEQGDPLDGYEGNPDLTGASGSEEVNKMWGEILNNAKTKNGEAGTGSPSLDRWFNKIGKPKINWKRRLMKFMNQCFAAQPRYGYFNKKFIAKDEYLPGMKYPKQEGFRQIVLIIDTSGSIDQNTLSKFASEFYGIFSTKKILQTTVIWCDDRIQKVEIMPTKDKSGAGISKTEFENKFLQRLRPRGQGGTSFIPPFKWIEENIIKKGQIPSFVVYFTDAAGSAPDPRKYGIPAYRDKVLWVITDCESAPHIQFPEKIFIDKNPDGEGSK